MDYLNVFVDGVVFRGFKNWFMWLWVEILSVFSFLKSSFTSGFTMLYRGWKSFIDFNKKPNASTKPLETLETHYVVCPCTGQGKKPGQTIPLPTRLGSPSNRQPRRRHGGPTQRSRRWT